MTLIIHLPDDLGRRLREHASCDGRAIEDYLLEIIERGAAGLESRPVDTPGLGTGRDSDLSIDEFERLLDELASGTGLPHPLTGFTRADIYADHD